MNSNAIPLLTIWIPSFGNGGVERMLVNLASGISEHGIAIDFVVRGHHHPYLNELPSAIRVIEIKGKRPKEAVKTAMDYLREVQPSVLLTSKIENDAIAIKARALTRSNTRIVVRIPVHITGRLEQKRKNLFLGLRRHQTYGLLRRLYSSVDTLVAVSKGVADDVARITGRPREEIFVAQNPVITPLMKALADEPADHAWFQNKEIPIVLGMGRLGRQKNFALLIKAFAMVRQKRQARLFILGEGRRHKRLQVQANKAGIAEDIFFAGFLENPYAYLSRADVFVLTSLWEGSPNALVEAMALGTDVVSTDCRSGPREILHDGRYGPLVPLDDASALSQAIMYSLDRPKPAESSKKAVRPYSLELSVKRYMEILGLGSQATPNSCAHFIK